VNRRTLLKTFAAAPVLLGAGYLLYSRKGYFLDFFVKVQNTYSDYFVNVENVDILSFLKANRKDIPLNEIRQFLDYPRPANINNYLPIEIQLNSLKNFIKNIHEAEAGTSTGDRLQDMIETDFETDQVMYVDSWLLSSTQAALLILDGYKDVL
jgi:hypothetical protein